MTLSAKNFYHEIITGYNYWITKKTDGKTWKCWFHLCNAV